MGHCVWWLLEHIWCKRCMQAAGIRTNRYIATYCMHTMARQNCDWLAVLTDDVVRPPIITFCLSSPSLCEFVSTGAIARSRAYFGRGTGAILLDQLRCTGNETRLMNCPSNPLGIHDCSHYEDAGVTCQGMHACLCSLTCLPSIQLLCILLSYGYLCSKPMTNDFWWISAWWCLEARNICSVVAKKVENWGGGGRIIQRVTAFVAVVLGCILKPYRSTHAGAC